MATEYTKPAGLEKVWCETGSKTPAPSDSTISIGWVVEIPKKEVANYIENKQDQMLAHVNQHGIPSWDSSSQYIANKSYVQGSNGIIYVANLDNTNVDPVTEVGSVNWRVAFYFRSEVYSKTEADAAYLRKSNNLSDLSNTATARSNLSVYSTSETNNLYCKRASNLADVYNQPAAFDNIKQPAAEGYAGTLQIASNSEAAAGSNNTKAVTPAKLKLGFSINLSAVGHIRFPSWLGNLVINWGSLDVHDQNGSNSGYGYQTASYTPVTNLVIVCSPTSNLGSPGTSYPQKANVSASMNGSGVVELVNYRDGGGSINISWIAIGTS